MWGCTSSSDQWRDGGKFDFWGSYASLRRGASVSLPCPCHSRVYRANVRRIMRKNRTQKGSPGYELTQHEGTHVIHQTMPGASCQLRPARRGSSCRRSRCSSESINFPAMLMLATHARVGNEVVSTYRFYSEIYHCRIYVRIHVVH